MKPVIRIRFIVLALVFALVLCSGLPILYGQNYASDVIQSPAKYMEELLSYQGWNLITDDSSAQQLTLPARIRAPHGDTIRIVNVLPRSLETGTCLAFESLNTSVTVKVDGEVVYRNLGEDEKAAISMWNFVSLEAAQAEAPITIEITGQDAYDTGIVPQILLGPKAEILVLLNAERSANMQISMSIVLLGLLVFLFSAITFTNSRFVNDFIILGVFIMLLGLSQLWQISSPAESVRTGFIHQCIAAGCFGLLPSLYCLYRGSRSEETVGNSLLIVSTVGVLFFFLVFAVHWLLPIRVFPHKQMVSFLFCELIYAFCLYSTLFREKDDSPEYRFLIALSLIIFIICVGLEGFTYVSYTSGIHVKPMILGSLIFSILHTIAVVLRSYNYIEQQLRISEELGESRIKLMVKQMRPHFIRSALGAIRNAIKNDPDKAYELIYDFTNYLSFNIDSLDSVEPVPFKTELKHIKEYMALEEERFYPRVRVEYEIEADEFLVPPLSVQPYVENAIKHGVLAKREGGMVKVITEETEEAFLVIVSDTGMGFDTENVPQALPSHGVSAKNAEYRLKNMIGAQVRTESVIGKGTTVTITISKEGNNHENNSGR